MKRSRSRSICIGALMLMLVLSVFANSKEAFSAEIEDTICVTAKELGNLWRKKKNGEILSEYEKYIRHINVGRAPNRPPRTPEQCKILRNNFDRFYSLSPAEQQRLRIKMKKENITMWSNELFD